MLRQLRTFLGTKSGSRAAVADRRRRRLVSGIERLEDRTVRSTFTVTMALDTVAGDGKMSLREAITAANAHPGADTIIVPAGMFRLSRKGTDDANGLGDLDIKDSTLIQGAGAGKTIIDGRQLDRVFDVHGTAPHAFTATFQGLTIRNGSADGGGGGGIRVSKANLVLQDCIVTGNKTTGSGGGISNAGQPGTGNVTLVRTTVDRNIAAQGGGVFVEADSQNKGSMLTATNSTIRRNIAREGGGVFATQASLTGSTISGNHAAVGNGGGLSVSMLTLANSTVNNNTAALNGGGMYADTATLSNCTVSGNSANSIDGGVSGVAGGGIWAVTATLTGSTVSSNSAAGGGGILASVATLTSSTVTDNWATTSAGGGILANRVTLNAVTLSNNRAASDGGGMRVVDATLTRSTVSGNSAVNGGGIVAFGTATLTNCTVSDNHAADLAGGVLGFALNLLNDTIVENDAHTAGGVLHFNGGVGPANVRNTIIADNLVDLDGSASDVSGTFASGGHNLIGVGTGGTGFHNGTNGDQIGTDLDPIDPGLGELASNGGPTLTHALLAGSPAVDHGDNTNVPATDQRNVARPRDGDGNGSRIVDIGAFER
jgi:predicted outer membrane repeat protein